MILLRKQHNPLEIMAVRPSGILARRRGYSGMRPRQSEKVTVQEAVEHVLHCR